MSEADTIAHTKINDAIRRLQTRKGANACQAHEDIAEALVVLLEVQAGRIDEASRMAKVGGIAGAVVSGIILGAVEIVRAIHRS